MRSCVVLASRAAIFTQLRGGEGGRGGVVVEGSLDSITSARHSCIEPGRLPPSQRTSAR